MRPLAWKAVDHYVSGKFEPIRAVHLVFKVPVIGSPQGSRRSVIWEGTAEQARTLARSLAKMADTIDNYKGGE